MNIRCIGISHRTAPIEIREKLWFSNQEIPAALKALLAKHAREAVLISTCNRTEFYYIPREDGTNGVPPWHTLAELKRSLKHAAREHFYEYAGPDAVRHLYAVVSGTDSMVLGDVQISGQVKEAFLLAQEEHATGVLLNRLFASALHLGKRARSETEIGEGAVSISYAAAELASKIFEDLSKRAVLLIGAGETGKLTARHLCSRNIGRLLVANRTRRNAEELASQLRGTVIEYERLREEVGIVDIIITAVNASDHILSSSDLQHAMRQRGNKPLFVIDIGVPRNVEPAANTIENVFLHDVDALRNIVDSNLARRQAEIPKVDAIINAELMAFEKWYHSLDASPTIQQLRDQLETIRQEEVSKHIHHFDPVKQEEIELLTRRIINKILHTPITNLKNGTDHEEEGRTKIFLIRHLFGLDKKHS